MFKCVYSDTVKTTTTTKIKKKQRQIYWIKLGLSLSILYYGYYGRSNSISSPNLYK